MTSATKRKSIGAVLRILAVLMMSLILVAGCGDDGADDQTGDSTPGQTSRDESDGGDSSGDEGGGSSAQAQREAKVLADATELEPLLDDFWTNELERLYQMAYDSPQRFEYYRETGNNPCGPDGQPKPENAYYCFKDDDEYVAFDLNWFQEYLIDHPGGATTFLILAHEWGHSVQDAWLESGAGDYWDPSYRQELNADCLAGVFLGRMIEAGAIQEEAGDADAVWGWLYESGSGPWFEPSDHGTSQQRQEAFSDGLSNGTDFCREKY